MGSEGRRVERPSLRPQTAAFSVRTHSFPLVPLLTQARLSAWPRHRPHSPCRPSNVRSASRSSTSCARSRPAPSKHSVQSYLVPQPLRTRLGLTRLTNSMAADDLLQRMISTEPYLSSRSLSIYLSMPHSEVQTLALVQHALAEDKIVWVPFIPKGGRMTMVRLYKDDGEVEWERDGWGIPVVGRERRNHLGPRDDGTFSLPFLSPFLAQGQTQRLEVHPRPDVLSVDWWPFVSFGMYDGRPVARPHLPSSGRLLPFTHLAKAHRPTRSRERLLRHLFGNVRGTLQREGLEDTHSGCATSPFTSSLLFFIKWHC